MFQSASYLRRGARSDLFPTSNVLVSNDLDGSSTTATVLSVNGTFSCKAFVHESFSIAQSLTFLVENLGESIAARLERMGEDAASSENVLLPRRYNFSMPGTPFSKGFFSFINGPEQENGDDETKSLVEKAFGLDLEDVHCVEVRNDTAKDTTAHSWPSLKTIVECPGGPAMKAFTKKGPVSEEKNLSNLSQGDAETPFDDFETISNGTKNDKVDFSDTEESRKPVEPEHQKLILTILASCW